MARLAASASLARGQCPLGQLRAFAFALPVGSHVHGDAGHLRSPAVRVVVQHDAAGEPSRTAVGAGHAVLQCFLLAPHGAGGPELALDAAAVFRGDAFEPAAQAGLAQLLHPEQLALGRCPGQPVGGELVVEESHVACLLGELHQALALAQLLVDRQQALLDFLALGDIDHGADRAARPAVGIAQRHGVGDHESRGAPFHDDLQFHSRNGFPQRGGALQGLLVEWQQRPWCSTRTAPA